MPKRDKRSFCLGMALRLMQNRLPLSPSQKEPVAFLYNGNRLPDIYSVYTPELQAQYPCAYIHRALWGGGCYLEFYKEPCYWEETSLGTSGYVLNSNTESVDFYCETGGNAWVESECNSKIGFSDALGTEGVSTELYWTNVDIQNPNGEGIYMAASDPIPVYE